MSQWFRFYESALDDPKVQQLPAKLFKSWVNLLCLASRRDGKIPGPNEVSFSLRLSFKEATETINALEDCGLLDRCGNGDVMPHNWNVRQYKSDVSTARVKRFRERRETVPETPSESEADTEADTEQNREDIGAVAPHPVEEQIHGEPSQAQSPNLGGLRSGQAGREIGSAIAGPVLSAWNASAARCGWPKVQRLSPARSKALTARLAEIGGFEGWETMLSKSEASEFLSGRAPRSNGHTGWAFNFDWALKPANLTKIMEGNYDNPQFTGAPNGHGRGGLTAFAAGAALLRGKQYRGL